MSIDYLTLAKTVRAAGCDSPAELEELCRQILVDRPTGGTWPPSGGGGSNLDGSGDPTSVVTPQYTGQYYRDTGTGNIWKSTGATSADWTLQVQDMHVSWTTTGKQLYQVVGIHGSHDIASSFDDITDITYLYDILDTYIYHPDAIYLKSVNLPNITRINGGDYVAYISLFVQSDAEWTLNAPLLEYCDGNVVFGGGVKQVILPSLITIAYQSIIFACAEIETVSFPLFVPQNGFELNMQGGGKLTLASVNHILSRFVANPAYISGEINVSGGTNAAPPTGPGTDHDTLVARGVTITHN